MFYVPGRRDVATDALLPNGTRSTSLYGAARFRGSPVLWYCRPRRRVRSTRAGSVPFDPVRIFVRGYRISGIVLAYLNRWQFTVRESNACVTRNGKTHENPRL